MKNGVRAFHFSYLKRIYADFEILIVGEDLVMGSWLVHGIQKLSLSRRGDCCGLDVLTPHFFGVGHTAHHIQSGAYQLS